MAYIYMYIYNNRLAQVRNTKALEFLEILLDTTGNLTRRSPSTHSSGDLLPTRNVTIGYSSLNTDTR
jgi:hypothetical protein